MNNRWEKLMSFIHTNTNYVNHTASRLIGTAGGQEERAIKDFMEFETKLDKQHIELFGLLCEQRFELFDTLLEQYIEENQKRRVEEEKRQPVRQHARGFSLIELLIVVAIILVIAAIAIPRLLSARTTAVEARAGTMTKTLGAQLVAYNVKWATFPAALTNLGGTTCDTAPPTATAACSMDDAIASQLAAPGVGQYTFTYATTGGVFTLNGDPLASSSAKRHFFIDSGLTVHYSDTAPATATDPAM